MSETTEGMIAYAVFIIFITAVGVFALWVVTKEAK